ncbi:955_t:CDS:2, partial [Acaulospora morrowiae]
LGATGELGTQIVNQALDASYHVIALKMIIESMVKNKVRRLIAITVQGIRTISGMDSSNSSSSSSSSNISNNEHDIEGYPMSPVTSTSTQIPVISKGLQRIFSKIFPNKILNDKEPQERSSWKIVISLTGVYRIMDNNDVWKNEKRGQTNSKKNSVKISRADVAHFIMSEIQYNAIDGWENFDN